MAALSRNFSFRKMKSLNFLLRGASGIKISSFMESGVKSMSTRTGLVRDQGKWSPGEASDCLRCSGARSLDSAMIVRYGGWIQTSKFSSAPSELNKCHHHNVQTRNFCSSTTSRDSEESRSNSTGKTYDAEEVEKFSSLSEDWWDEFGEFQALHSLNALRIPLVRDGLCPEMKTSGSLPLQGLKIADIGCGGGILSEPLARLGADVMGIDASSSNIEAAIRHAETDPGLAGRVEYRSCLVEDLSQDAPASFDALVASEILEHVANPKTFIKACCDLVAPGGSLFFTTMNRTLLARALAVFAAERILRIVPAGAHDWNKFISPQELTDILKENDAAPRLVHGMILNPFTMRWSWCSDTSMNYALHAIKGSNQS